MKPDDLQHRDVANKIVVLPPLENEKDQLKRMRIYDVEPESDG